MLLFFVRILLTAAAFTFILPMIKGIDFHGNFWIAVLAAVLFGIVAWLVDLLVMLLSAFFTITSFGLALLWLIPVWIVGYFLFPAVALKGVAHLMPTHITVDSWIAAAQGGLVMLLIGICTNPKLFKRK
jgi:uncharacterized membrane protein YvlD (DUF360 family)